MIKTSKIIVWILGKSHIVVHVLQTKEMKQKKGIAGGDYYQTWQHEKTSGFKSGHPQRKKQ